MHAGVTTPLSALTTAQFDYALPADRIAQTPLAQRDTSRLLHVASGGRLSDHTFTELPSLLQPGDLLVVNDTRVRHARLRGTTAGGAAVEMLVASKTDDRYTCLIRPARRLPVGAQVRINDELVAVCVATSEGQDGARTMRFDARDGAVDAAIERAGEAPLPPYIRAPLEDAERYQTTYARGEAVSAAAPTAGLHFSDAVRESLRLRGIGWTTLQLEVGLGTFMPIRTERVAEHRMHAERFAVTPETAEAIAAARARSARVVAVGTTVMRALEAAAQQDGEVRAGTGETSLFIMPGYRFSVADALLTNFHQPRSTLLVLLAAFIGMDRWREAYAHAIAGGYRFLSFGDCMLCWRHR